VKGKKKKKKTHLYFAWGEGLDTFKEEYEIVTGQKSVIRSAAFEGRGRKQQQGGGRRENGDGKRDRPHSTFKGKWEKGGMLRKEEEQRDAGRCNF